MIDGGVLLQKGLEAVVSELGKRAAVSLATSFVGGVPTGYKAGFDGHFKYSYEKCSRIKTILKPDVSVDLLSCYVNMNHRIDSENVDDFELIERIHRDRRFIVTGEGGGGKSMFMRYFWISMTENSRGKIPIYIELKNVNDRNVSILEYIILSALDEKNSSSEVAFQKMLQAGSFIFILDGFDELRIDARDRVQSELLSMSELFDRNIYVVSGRPDDRYNSWVNFTRSKVQPLSLRQACLLIERVEYFEDIRKEFYSKLKRREFSNHMAFIERPLLLCMMLVTYKHTRDIPNKLHLFYSYAFEALYSEHDSFKDGFKRDMRSKLPPDVFRRILSFLSLLSYKDQKYEFSKTDLLKYISDAISVSCSVCESLNYLGDLVEAVCIIQKEGIIYSFVHRSFQEYFTALCLSSMDPEIAAPLIDRFSANRSDSVVVMLYDINESLVKNHFFLKFIDSRISDIEFIAKAKGVIDVVEHFGEKIHCEFDVSRVPGSSEVFGCLSAAFYIPSKTEEISNKIGTIQRCLGGGQPRRPRKIARSKGDAIAFGQSLLSRAKKFFDYEKNSFSNPSVKMVRFILERNDGENRIAVIEYVIRRPVRGNSGSVRTHNFVLDDKNADFVELIVDFVYGNYGDVILNAGALKRSIPKIRRNVEMRRELLKGLLLS